MSNKEKILVILTPAFPANESEYWLFFQQVLLSSIKKLYPDIRIIVLSFTYPTVSNYYWKGIEVFSFGGRKYKKFGRLFLWRNTWKKLNEINNKARISAILSFWCGECALVGSYFGRMNLIKHFVWICGQDARKKNKMIRFIRPRPGELIAMSDFLVDEFYKNHHIKPAHLILNGIDPSMFTLANQKRDIDFIGAGSLSFLKQYNIFLEIVARLKDKLPDIKAVLCGDGEHKDVLEQMIEEFSLQQNVELVGMKTPAETIGLMQRSKIFLHPSSYEGFSTACLEALYAGNHVISFVKPMHHEIKNWHIVRTKEQMLQKTFELLSNDETIYEPVLVNNMDESARKMIELFGFTE